MLDLLNSCQTVFMEMVFKMNIQFCCHLCCSISVIFNTVLFSVQQSLSLSFVFDHHSSLLMKFSHDLCMYAIITLETAAVETPNKVTVLVTDAPPKHAPTICPL